MSKRELHLGLMFWAGGTHPSGWRYPSSHAAAAFDIEFLQQVTQLVERAKFDFLFLGDRLASDPSLQTTNPSQMSRLEPFVSGASLAAATSHIGIVVTANPTYYDPYNLARMFASLDHLSQGRASWNLVTGADAIAAGNFSREAHWDTEKRYDWAEEFVTVVRQLWDSDASTPLRHKGRYFDVAGPLNVKRPPQGHPVILHAGTSDRSRELGARDADVIFAGQATFEAAKSYYADVKSRARKYGRKDDDIAILPGLTAIVAETTEQAVAIFDRLNAFIELDREGDGGEASRYGSLGRMGKRRNLTAVSAVIGVDIAGRDRDAPVDPQVLAAANDEGQRLFADVTRLTRRDVKGPNRLTYRDLIIGHIGIGAVVVGNPNEVADHIELWFNERAADGFNIFPPFVPESVEAFTSLVVPVLQRRGLYRTDYSGTTFRDHLGLATPKPLLPDGSHAAS
jgi:alkanesulfonate monooxygenase SsuD/methylene tetrahydromethanopterin reductase-like flavin-dependent oxidoreductase (luciferase family)